MTLDEAEANHERLHEEKLSIDMQIAEIRSQMDDDDAGVGPTREPGWKGRANFAMRRLGQDSQRVQRLIGASGRLLKRARQATYEQCFIEAARESLAAAAFSDISHRAHAMSSQRMPSIQKDVAVTAGPDDQ